MASTAPVHLDVFRFGVFEFNSATTELLKSGTKIRLQPQIAKLLTLLVSRAGDLITRDAIREKLWGNDVTVDFELGINRCVGQLRGALQDDIGTSRYIETVPRLGYRFIAPVSSLAPAMYARSARIGASAQTTKADLNRFPSIAILPFANLSGAAEDEYFSDGLAEEIINALAQIPGLKVIARTSAFAFKGKNEDVREIAGKLGVSNILEGTVRRSGTRLRTTAQLIDATDGTHLWSKRYDREMTDVFAVQDEIASAVAEQMRFSFTLGQRTATSPAAYQALVEGRFHFYKLTPTGFAKAFGCFERSLTIDPNFSPAFSGLALNYIAMVIQYLADPLETLPKAVVAAQRALDLDEDNAEAHAALADLAAMFDYNWWTAEWHFRRARELNPGSMAKLGYVNWYLLPFRRIKEATAECDLVIERDPLFVMAYTSKALALFAEGRYEAAAETCLAALEFDPAYPHAIQRLAFARAFQSRDTEAVTIAERLIEARGRSFFSLHTLGIIQAICGERESAARALVEIHSLPYAAQRGASGIAAIHALLGEKEAAFHWLEQAITERDPRILFIETLPFFNTLHSDSRFGALLTRIGLHNTR